MDHRAKCKSKIIKHIEGVVVFQSLVMANSFETPWTIAQQAPLSMGFSGQKYWNGLTFPSPGDLSNPGIELVSPALAGRFFTTEPPGKPILKVT